MIIPSTTIETGKWYKFNSAEDKQEYIISDKEENT